MKSKHIAGELTDQSWDCVRDYIDALGIFPSSFTSCVRSLLMNERQNAKTGERGINPACRAMLVRLMFSPTLSSMIYYATRTFKFDLCPEDKVWEPEEIVKLYHPREMAALLSVIYIYRCMGKLCNRDEWEKYNRTMIKSIEIGGLLGRMIPGIGFARGLFAGAYPRFGLCTLMIGNLKGFKDYRALLREGRELADLGKEVEIFGCDSVQIGSRMLQLFGFGAEVTKQFYFGVTETGDKQEQREEVIGFTVCSRWIASLIQAGEPPQQSLGDEFEVDELNFEIFYPHIRNVVEKESRYGWLEAGEKELAGKIVLRESGGKVPIVRRRTASEVSGSTELPADLPKEVPLNYDQLSEEMQEVFNKEDLDSLCSSVQELLDQ